MMLDDELDAALDERAEHDGVSKAELLRAFARDRLLLRPIADDDPVWELCGQAGDGPDLVDDDLAGRVSQGVNQALHG